MAKLQKKAARERRTRGPGASLAGGGELTASGRVVTEVWQHVVNFAW